MIYVFPEIYGPFTCEIQHCQNETQICFLEADEAAVIKQSMRAATILIRRLGKMVCKECLDYDAYKDKIREEPSYSHIGVIGGCHDDMKAYFRCHRYIFDPCHVAGRQFHRIVLVNRYYDNPLWRENFDMVKHSILPIKLTENTEIAMEDPIEFVKGNVGDYATLNKINIERYQT